MSWIVCGLVLHVSDETEYEYWPIAHKHRL